MKNRKIILVLIALMIITSTIIMNGCGIEEKTTEYTFPEMITTATGQTQDSAIAELEPSGGKDDLVTSVRNGTDGSIIVEVTDKQREIWLDDIEKTIEQCKKDAVTIGCEITVNDECTEFTYKVDGNADVKQVTKNGAFVSTRCMQHQIFNGVSADEIKLQRTIINSKTGKVMASVNLDEEITINPEDWDE